jgi:sugar phosphate isomerase/epimerase
MNRNIGIFAKTFPGKLPDVVLTQVAAAGFGAAHFNMACCGLPAMPDAIAVSAAETVADAAGQAGVWLAGLSGTWNMIHPDSAVREAGMRRLEVLAKACSPMQVRLITLCTGTRDPLDQWRAHPDNASLEAWRDLTAAMEQAAGIAERYGVELGIEPELANVVDNAAKARQLIDEMGSPRLKIVLDPANLFEVETPERRHEIVAHAIDLLGGHIAMAHAKDRDGVGNFVAAGHGVIDFAHFLGALKSAGFAGPLVCHGLTAVEAPAVAKFLQRTAAEVDWT